MMLMTLRLEGKNHLNLKFITHSDTTNNSFNYFATGPAVATGSENHASYQTRCHYTDMQASQVRTLPASEMCGLQNLESTSVHRFWPKICVHVNMQSWVRSDVTGNTYLQFTGDKPSAQYSLTASNGSVVSCYNIHINNSGFYCFVSAVKKISRQGIEWIGSASVRVRSFSCAKDLQIQYMLQICVFASARHTL